MKTCKTLILILLVGLLQLSCKDNGEATATEERIEQNHPTDSDNIQIQDSSAVLKDSLIDHNMKGQSDTHGRNVQDGD